MARKIDVKFDAVVLLYAAVIGQLEIRNTVMNVGQFIAHLLVVALCGSRQRHLSSGAGPPYLFEIV